MWIDSGWLCQTYAHQEEVFTCPVMCEHVKACPYHKIDVWIHDFQGKLEDAREAAFAAGILQDDAEYDDFIRRYLEE